MKRYFGKVSLCENCGFLMAAAVDVDGIGRAPIDGDNSICADCGMLYIFEAGDWRGARIADMVEMPPDMLSRALTRMEIASAARRARRRPPRKEPVQ